MAYITSEQVKEMRDMIKKAFPASKGWKWSVTKEHHSAVVAALMQYPAGYDFHVDKDGYQQVNHYWFDKPNVDGEMHYGKKETKVLQKVNEILHTGHWDESDIMTDYFDCSHYVILHIGKWDRPAVQAKPKASKAKTVVKKAVTSAYTQRDKDFLMVADFIGIQY